MSSLAANPTAINSDLQQLLPHHRADLRSSGLSDETIRAWGCYSIQADQKSVLVQLGCGHLNPPALALPIIPPDCARPDLNNVMLKPDQPRLDGRGRAAKYEARPRSRNRIHVPLAIRNVLSDRSVRLVITEGQKKAEKAAQEGICVIALAGVCNWKDRVGESSFPISDFELILISGRAVLICFDSDAVSNPHVRQAERDLAAFLRKRFSARVSIKRPGRR